MTSTTVQREPELTDSSTRIDWIDTAKALAIVLVVLYHVGNAAASYLLPHDAHALNSAIWGRLNTILLPVRMPLFFFASGLLAASAVQRPWRDVVRPRIADLIWPFLLWSLLFAPAYAVGYLGQGVASGSLVTLTSIPVGGNAYWYLSALVVFFVVAKSFRRFAPALVLGAGVLWVGASSVSSLAVGHLGAHLGTNVGRWAWFFVWFAVGCFLKRAALQVVDAATRPSSVIVAVSAFAAIAYLVYWVGGADPKWGYVLTVLGILGLAALSSLACRSSRVRRGSRYLARRTLPIYLLHPLLLNLVVAAARAIWGRTDVVPDLPLVGLIFTPVVTALLVVVAVTFFDVATRRLGGRLLFMSPPTARRFTNPTGRGR